MGLVLLFALLIIGLVMSVAPMWVSLAAGGDSGPHVIELLPLLAGFAVLMAGLALGIYRLPLLRLARAKGPDADGLYRLAAVDHPRRRRWGWFLGVLIWLVVLGAVVVWSAMSEDEWPAAAMVVVWLIAAAGLLPLAMLVFEAVRTAGLTPPRVRIDRGEVRPQQPVAIEAMIPDADPLQAGAIQIALMCVSPTNPLWPGRGFTRLRYEDRAEASISDLDTSTATGMRVRREVTLPGEVVGDPHNENDHVRWLVAVTVPTLQYHRKMHFALPVAE